MNIIKYGVEKASFESMFKFILSINRRIGLDISADKPSAHEILNACLYNFPLTLTYVFLLISALTETDKTTIGSCLLVITGGMVNIAPKFLTFLFSGQDIKNLMKMVVLNTNEKIMKNADNEQKQILKKYVAYARITTNIEFFSFCFSFLFNYVTPYIISIVWNKWINPLGLKIMFVDATSHPGYELHILFTLYTVAYNLILMGSADIIFFYFTLYIGYQFDNCKYLVSTLGDETNDPNTNSKILRQVAIEHSEITQFCRRCAKTFGAIIFFEIASSSLSMVVCLTAYDTKPWLYTMGMQVVTLQLLIFCLFAELVNTKAKETSIAIYSCKWYNIQRIRDKKILLMLLHHSQQSMSFSVFGMMALSLESFVQVIRAAFSYYTFLKSVL